MLLFSLGSFSFAQTEPLTEDQYTSDREFVFRPLNQCLSRVRSTVGREEIAQFEPQCLREFMFRYGQVIQRPMALCRFAIQEMNKRNSSVKLEICEAITRLLVVESTDLESAPGQLFIRLTQDQLDEYLVDAKRVIDFVWGCVSNKLERDGASQPRAPIYNLCLDEAVEILDGNNVETDDLADEIVKFLEVIRIKIE